MNTNKKLILIFLFISSLVFAEDDWIKVSHQEKVVHQLQEEDRSIWVVFSKSFGEERVLLRFPEDPVYRHEDGYFKAIATHLGIGEMTFMAKKKSSSGLQEGVTQLVKEVSYLDHETERWIFEKHIETEDYFYVLRYSHPSPSANHFRLFVNSFEIERTR